VVQKHAHVLVDQAKKAEPPAPVIPAAPRKRFRIDKIEERIAPGGKKSTNCASVSSGYGGSIY
jgi:hypothetical protein